ncbi:hypothetical protein PORY_002484 [Pneumocystis oryctolagi]|uniref:Uncharacterized protein n=1 Tax=Pneumocystis oryctolagi TaxID=42067 RepID=A0ACB7CAR3_9ASCO|nr:hypothetical protein PORY_002484 [Pneumocystis oryctolagi]
MENFKNGDKNMNTSISSSISINKTKENGKNQDLDTLIIPSKESGECVNNETTFEESKKIKKNFEKLETKADLLNNHLNKTYENTLLKTCEIPDSLHQLTCAVYVRNFTRPLQISQLESHLLDIIKEINNSCSDLFKKIWMDKFRTHAFIVLSAVEYAKKIRNCLHNSIWPCEKGRRSLWADYIPENKVDEWIDIEEQSPKDIKWEVIYDVEGKANLSKIEKKNSYNKAVLNEEVKKRFQEESNDKNDIKRQNIEKNSLNKLFLKTQTVPFLYYKTADHNITMSNFKVQNDSKYKT